MGNDNAFHSPWGEREELIFEGLKSVRPKVLVQKLDKEMPLPKQAHYGDAGYDLTCRHLEFHILGGKRAVMDTGLAVAIPQGYAGIIMPRSGLAQRYGLTIVNSPGLIDSGYRGEISIIFLNTGTEDIFFRQGDRVAQLVIMPIPEIIIEEVDTLPESERGKQGFGSTGVK